MELKVYHEKRSITDSLFSFFRKIKRRLVKLFSR